jgi:hypothetical protein
MYRAQETFTWKANVGENHEILYINKVCNV